MMESEFPLDPNLIYLNHAAVAPWPTRTAEAVKAFAEENVSIGSKRYLEWLKTEQRLRERLARLINAPSTDDIALVKNTSEALSFVAQGLTWKRGDNIVGIAQEFPSNRIVWESLANQGVEVRLLDLYGSTDPEADLIALCDADTRLLAVSAVQYARGLRMDLERLGEYCQRRDTLFCVDAIQQIGALPFDVQAVQADFAAADGHKWMFGPEGLAVFYVRETAREHLKPSQFGWHMVEHVGDFDRPDWQPAHSARRYECGSPNMLGIHALNASLSLIEQIGMPNISSKINENIDITIEYINKYSLKMLSDISPERRSGIISFAVPGAEPEPIYKSLMARGVMCAPRGGGIRFSPHFYTSSSSLEQAFAILEDITG